MFYKSLFSFVGILSCSTLLLASDFDPPSDGDTPNDRPLKRRCAGYGVLADAKKTQDPRELLREQLAGYVKSVTPDDEEEYWDLCTDSFMNSGKSFAKIMDFDRVVVERAPFLENDAYGNNKMSLIKHFVTSDKTPEDLLGFLSSFGPWINELPDDVNKNIKLGIFAAPICFDNWNIDRDYVRMAEFAKMFQYCAHIFFTSDMDDEEIFDFIEKIVESKRSIQEIYESAGVLLESKKLLYDDNEAGFHQAHVNCYVISNGITEKTLNDYYQVMNKQGAFLINGSDKWDGPWVWTHFLMSGRSPQDFDSFLQVITEGTSHLQERNADLVRRAFAMSFVSEKITLEKVKEFVSTISTEHKDVFAQENQDYDSISNLVSKLIKPDKNPWEKLLESRLKVKPSESESKS